MAGILAARPKARTPVAEPIPLGGGRVASVS
jgi:hypothetical protein